jgi:glycosyltransferase involved in cell wall biosynthesis
VKKTAKIILIGNFLPDRQESMLRFEQSLLGGFSERGVEVKTWRPEPHFARWMRYRYSGLPKYLGYIDKFVIFPRAIHRRILRQPADTVYHIVDHGNAVYARHFPAESLLVTCHDLLQIRSAKGEFQQNQIGRSGQKYQNWILDSLRNLRRVACISQKTRSDLIRLTGLPAERIDVVYNGLNYPYRPMPTAEARPLFEAALARQNLSWPKESVPGAPFLFSIGGAQWYKNRDGLLRVFGEVCRKEGAPEKLGLIYVGPEFDPSQKALISEYGIKGRVLRVPALTNEELRAAYSLAAGLLFPSWEEGFGWPIAEAQACGCPVFTSNRPPMTEVGGDAARYLNPSDPAGAAEEVLRGLALPDNMRAAGLQNAKRWAPQLMLDAYQEIYDHLVSASAPS